MKKALFTQDQLKSWTAEGKTHIWKYRTLYQICFCSNLGNGEYYLHTIIDRGLCGAVTKRGQHIACTAEEARRLQEGAQ